MRSVQGSDDTEELMFGYRPEGSKKAATPVSRYNSKNYSGLEPAWTPPRRASLRDFPENV
jgi:hypothetical protein